MLLLLSASLCIAAQTSPVEFRTLADGRVEVVAAISESQAKHLPLGVLTSELGEARLRVCAVDAKSVGLPMLGLYERTPQQLIFRPRFAFEPGRTYQAFIGPADAAIASAKFQMAPSRQEASAAVAKVYPTANVLPANHLKFHLIFTRPMRGGQAIFQQIEILDADGNAISDAWLTDELWDADGKELILYIHPGRIKWGVVLRDLLGPVLLPGREYTLVVRGTMLDADGQPLGKDYRKIFKTVDEDRTRIDLSKWSIAPPKADTRDPVAVTFPKSLDRASLGKFLKVVNASGKSIDGTMALGESERSWSWKPARPWTAGHYQIAVDAKLEDVAGNTPLRPFDLDLQSPPLPPQILNRPFEVR